jgi:DNA-binding NarL/FixJ family response regulator
MTIRVLIVDDHEDWRRTVRELLKGRPGLQVISEVSDGLEAVQKADELKPDLILLDIGLPQLNGIEAARRIRNLVPESKIIFLSQDNSFDPDELGAQGFVHKARAQSELLATIEAVLRDRAFVSASLKGYKFADTAGEKPPHCHEVQFYFDDEVFLDSFARFIAVALKDGNAAIAVATK